MNLIVDIRSYFGLIRYLKPCGVDPILFSTIHPLVSLDLTRVDAGLDKELYILVYQGVIAA